MQPAPPAALELAQRLRQLRQQWPRLTQDQLASAFGAEGSLASATVSSWESLKSPKLPPIHRLDAYARFFTTARSIEGEPRLLPLGEFTPDEKTAYEKLKAELLMLRNAASGETPAIEQTFKRSWNFSDTGRITIVCAQLPVDQMGPFGDPSNPNYTELQTYADIDSLVELFGHVRMENPMSRVRFRTPSEIQRDDLSGHLILLGGVVWNDITGRLSDMAKLPIMQVERPGLDSGEIFISNIDGESREFWPRWTNNTEGRKVLTQDVGLLARVPNPLNASRTLTICNGIHSRGVYGAVRTLTDAELREGNEHYISSNFGDAGSFAILMAVAVIENKTITPDFNTPGVVLYQWGRDVA
jgi:transcriptional regulator with XRE-family HTH domain